MLTAPVRETTDTRARESMASQILTGSHPFGISLDALWRACGEPAHESPADWIILAAPLIQGFPGYRRRIWAETAHARHTEFVAAPPVWHLSKRTMALVVEHLGGPGALEVGDTMTHEELASVYCAFLEQAGLRRSLTRTGGKVYREFQEATAGAARLECVEPVPEMQVKLEGVSLPRRSVNVVALSG